MQDMQEMGPSCPFCAQLASHPSPIESDWSDEDWNGEKQRVKEEKKKDQQGQEKNKEKKVPNDFCPTSLVYDPTFKQDPLPCCSPKEKLALDPNYYPPNYVPEEEDAPLLIDNLVIQPKKSLKEEGQGQQEEKEDEVDENRSIRPVLI